jgi:hypothetical protein
VPISHETKWFGVNDAKISKLLTDPAGGPATYGTAIDVPGMKTVGVAGEVNTNELRGDGQRIDQSSVLAGLTVSFEFAKMALDVFSVLAGGTVIDAGTAAAEKATFKLGSGDALNYFKFEAQTTGVDIPGGDGHLVVYKCILTSFPELGMAEEDFQTFSVEAACMGTIASDGDDLFDIVLNETAIDIAA